LRAANLRPADPKIKQPNFNLLCSSSTATFSRLRKELYLQLIEAIQSQPYLAFATCEFCLFQASSLQIRHAAKDIGPRGLPRR
jgi:hypothetical protein